MASLVNAAECKRVLEERAELYGTFTGKSSVYAYFMEHVEIKSTGSKYWSKKKAESRKTAEMLKALIALKASRILIAEKTGTASADSYIDFVNYLSFIKELRCSYTIELNSKAFNENLKDLEFLIPAQICEIINAGGVFSIDTLAKFNSLADETAESNEISDTEITESEDTEDETE